MTTPDQLSAEAWQQDTETLIAALVRLLRAIGFDPAEHCAFEELDDLLGLVDRVVRRYQCPHCDPTHDDPHRAAWGVRVGSEVDGDGQPTHLVVQPTDGAHVAQPDADWLWLLIRDRVCVHVRVLPPVPDPEPVQSPQLSHRRVGRGA